MEHTEIEITKEEYEADDNFDFLYRKYNVTVAPDADYEKNFDGKKYTLDIWQPEFWTEQDEAIYAPLRRKKLRIDAKLRRDKTRLRKFSHKSKKANQIES